MKRAGYLEQDGDMWLASQAGLDRAGVAPAAPATTTEMVEMWNARLKRGARDMLAVLVTTYPGSLARHELADALGMAETGGTFQTYLSTLRRNGLADVDGGVARASDSLFLTQARTGMVPVGPLAKPSR